MGQSEPPFSFSAVAARAVLAAFAVVLALSAAWALRAPAEAQSIRDGSFIRQSGANDIYRVNIVNGKRFKWLVVNEAAFCSYGCPWGSVINVSRSVMARYTTSYLARRGSDEKVWRFAPSGDSGTRRWLNITDREFEAAGFDWDAVHSITTTDFNQYTRGSDLTCADFNVCNEPPRITDARNLSFDAGERVTSRRVATISDRDTRLRDLTVRVSGLPSGWRHSFSTSSGRLIVSGTAPSRAGSHRVTITASDGQGSDTERFTITVNATHDPEITLTDDGFAVQAGERVTSRRVATIHDRDTRLRDLTVRVSGLPSGWRHSFSTSSGRLTVSGTAPSRAGSHRVTIRVSDGRGSDTERFTITVTAPDCAETIQSGSFIRRSGTEDVYRVRIANGKRFKWLILNESAFNSYGVSWDQICDTSQSVLNRYTTSTLARRGSDEKVWRFTSSGDSGTRRWLNITASEFERAGYDWDAVFSLRSGDFNAYTEAIPPTTCDNVDGRNVCDIRPAPVISIVSSSVTWDAGQRVSQQHVATLTDADTALRDLIVDVSGLPAGVTHSFGTSSGRLTVSGTAPSSAGSHRVTITSSDGPRSDTETFTITVAAAPPDCAETIQDGSFIRQSGTADVYRVRIANGKQFKWLILNEAAFNSYGVAWDRICDTSQWVLSRYTTSTLARRGSDEEVWRFESSGDSGTRRWLNITASEFERAGYDWDAVFSLQPGDFNAYTTATPPTTCDNVDGRNVCDEPEESTTTGGTNTPPEITNLTALLTVTEGQSVGETQVATVTDHEDALQLNRHVRINGLPPGLVAHGLSSTGRLTISGTVAADTARTYTATIAANDGTNLGVAEDFQITVLPGEGLPTFDPAVFVVEQRLILGRSETVQLAGASGGSPPLTYTLRDAPAGMVFDADALTVNGTLTGATGSHTMYLRATDDAGRSAEQRITYTILSCVDDRTEAGEPLGAGDTRTWQGEWTSQDCTTVPSQYITDHIGHYRDIYSFVTSERVDVTIDLESDDVGTYIHLLDNDGQRVDLSSASSGGNDASVKARLRAGQKYWVRATTEELGDVGAYTLSIAAVVVNIRHTIAEAYAPILTFDSRERYFPVPIEAMLDHSDLRMRTGGTGLGFDTGIRLKTITVAGPSDDPPSSVYPALLALVESSSDEQHLDFDREAWDRSSNSAEYQEKYPPTIYARVDKIDGNLVLQYWFFYVYNPGPVLKRLVGEERFGDHVLQQAHEGDWEGVQLVFGRGVNEDDVIDGIRAGTYVKPLYVEYATHKGGERHCWDDAQVEKETAVRVKVYPALGSHATYPIPHPTGVAVFGPAVKVVGWWDKNDEGGKVLDQYHIEMIDHQTGWIQWRGRWGEDNRLDDLPKFDGAYSGPQGPKTKPRWSDLSWADDEDGCNRYGVIAVKRHDDGRTEFGYRPTGSDLILPTFRHVRAHPQPGRVYKTSDVRLGETTLGHIRAMALSNGRFAVSFVTPTWMVVQPTKYIVGPVILARVSWAATSEIDLDE